MNKILSVSVAAYNVERFIDENLRSFLDSGVLDRVEILVTDDGSKDHTAQIVSGYAEQYPESIFLISKKNEGAGSTVNSGISHATGKYFRMVDGDDWVEPSEFARLVNLLETTDSDMVLCDYTEVDDTTRRQVPVPMKLPCGDFLFSDICRGCELDMHNTIWRTSVLKEHSIRLFNGYYTDVQYLLFPVPYAKTVSVTPFNVYRYRVALEGQSMNPVSMQKHSDEHDAVLHSLIDLFTRYCTENGVSASDDAIASYLLSRVKKMAGTQFGTLLSFPPTKENKKAVFAFFDALKVQNHAVWTAVSTFPTVRLIRIGHGIFYPMLSRRYRKAHGLK